MDTNKLLDIATELLIDVAPRALRGSRDAIEALERGITLLKRQQSEGRDPSMDEWDELNGRITNLTDQLNRD